MGRCGAGRKRSAECAASSEIALGKYDSICRAARATQARPCASYFSRNTQLHSTCRDSTIYLVVYFSRPGPHLRYKQIPLCPVNNFVCIKMRNISIIIISLYVQAKLDAAK